MKAKAMVVFAALVASALTCLVVLNVRIVPCGSGGAGPPASLCYDGVLFPVTNVAPYVSFNFTSVVVDISGCNQAMALFQCWNSTHHPVQCCSLDGCPLLMYVSRDNQTWYSWETLGFSSKYTGPLASGSVQLPPMHYLRFQISGYNYFPRMVTRVRRTHH